MTLHASTPTDALQSLGATIGSYDRPGVALGPWRWRVRRELAGVRDALVAESGSGSDGWTAAREGSALRERNALLIRLGALGSQVLEEPEADLVVGELRRLLTDVSHHLQRMNDLAYDSVELELGGSE